MWTWQPQITWSVTAPKCRAIRRYRAASVSAPGGVVSRGGTAAASRRDPALAAAAAATARETRSSRRSSSIRVQTEVAVSTWQRDSSS